jgi:hypothetical protein
VKYLRQVSICTWLHNYFIHTTPSLCISVLHDKQQEAAPQAKERVYQNDDRNWKSVAWKASVRHFHPRFRADNRLDSRMAQWMPRSSPWSRSSVSCQVIIQVKAFEDNDKVRKIPCKNHHRGLANKENEAPTQPSSGAKPSGPRNVGARPEEHGGYLLTCMIR